MRVIIVLVALLALLPSITLADAEPIPPITIFDNSVTIRTVQPQAEQTEFMYDNDFRLMAVGDQVVPYPAELLQVLQLTSLDDENLFIIDLIPREESHQRGLRDWIYHISTQTLRPFAPECQPNRPLRRLPEEKWVIVVEDDKAYLCNVFTGNRSSALPDDVLWRFNTTFDGRHISTSPDGRYVAVFGLPGVDPMFADYPSGSEAVLYSYHVETDELMALGSFRVGAELGFDRWFDTQVTFRTGDSRSASPVPVNIYIADLTQAESVQFGIGSYWSPSFLDNPPRYVVGFDAPYTSAPCGSITFDVTTRQTTQLDLDGLCRPEYGDAHGVGYYRDVPQGVSFECCGPVPVEIAEVPVVSYDSRTGERQELYRGEIEDIIWVSEDERFAILLLDISGQIDWFPYFDDFRQGDLELPLIALRDLRQQRFIDGSIPIQILDSQRHIYDWRDNLGIYPLSDNRFINIFCISGATTCDYWFEYRATQITITDDDIEEIELVRSPIMLTPNNSGLFIWSQPRFSDRPEPDYQGINIYDLATGETRPLTREFAADEYRVYLENVDELELPR